MTLSMPLLRELPQDSPMYALKTPASRQPATRYSDQPLSTGTRLFGLAGVALIVMAIAGVALFSWTVFHAPTEPARLSVFNVAPPAALPEPASGQPPGLEQIKKERLEPAPDRPKLPPVEIQLPTASPSPVPVVHPVVDPGPTVEDATAPEAKTEAPAEQPSTAKPTWQGLVQSALNKVKRYPRQAAVFRQQGVPYIRFVMDRDGKVLSSHIERSSGFRALDDEAISLPKRAQPLPKPPDDMKGATIELVVPVEFFMR
ncbi:TonB family protein (plasmid) [Novosphingobium sp. BL-8A]|uniref:energy transducer TonB family protein n=1 Tax=Novosphingobium sp. BL-8A TaxID=3127639 RepID=UPI003756532C